MLLLVLAGALSYLLVDEGPSDDSDLRTARVEVPAAENGYLIVKDLQVDLPFDEVSAWDAEGDSWDPRLGRRLLEKNAGALMALEEALRKPRFQLPAIDRFDQMDVTVAMHLRRLSNLMGIRLRVHRESGEIGEALEDALRILRFGRVLEGAGDTIVIFLVGDAIQETGLRLLETLRLLLSPSQAKECARVLVKLRPDREGLAESLRLEYRMVLPEVDAAAEGRSEDFPMPPLLRHLLFRRNATRRLFADTYRGLLEEIRAGGSTRSIPDPFTSSGEKWWKERNALGRALLKMTSPVFSAPTRMFELDRKFLEAAARFGGDDAASPAR